MCRVGECVDLREGAVDVYRAVQKPTNEYPGRHFTPDGQLIGSIGEVIAAKAFGFTLYHASTRGHDASCPVRRQVQIKITAGTSIAMRGPCALGLLGRSWQSLALFHLPTLRPTTLEWRVSRRSTAMGSQLGCPNLRTQCERNETRAMPRFELPCLLSSDSLRSARLSCCYDVHFCLRCDHDHEPCQST